MTEIVEGDLVTKQDMTILSQELRQETNLLRRDMQAMGTMLTIAVGILAAILKIS